MQSRSNSVERRKHPRVGALAQVEDITYGVLRKHGILSGFHCETPVVPPIRD